MAEIVTKTLSINKELVDWLNETYPGTSFTWVVNRALEKLKQAHEENPIDYFQIGAKALKKEIESGV